MFLLDSDIVIWLLRNDTKIVKIVGKLANQGELAVSAITIAEIFKNIFPEELSTTESFFSKNKVFDVTAEIAQKAGFYWRDFHKKFANLSITDCIVAATAQHKNVDLLTLNIRHFPMTDINIIKPS